MTLFKTVAAVGAASLVACGFYFYYKRRSDLNFTEESWERAARAYQREQDDNLFAIPDFENEADMESYFLDQYSVGYNLLQRGSIELGAFYLGKAMVCSGKHTLELVQNLKSCLPKPIFELVLKSFEKINDLHMTKMPLNINYGYSF